MNKQPILSYPEIRHRLTTFTIINCEHKDIFYRLIGHTAVVYRCQETGQVMVLESSPGHGVHLTPMGKWLSEYPGKVFVRIPEYPEGYLYGPKNQYNAEAFIRKHLGSSYPDLQTWSGKMKLVLAALDLKIFGKDLFTYDGDDEGIFCTMLVIMFLQYCGLMSEEAVAFEYEPDDLRYKYGVMLNWLINVKYGKEIRIK